ncbi:unnamed protein product, partial [Mesorhabditis belari]|uniref:Uncharacterized protein n=1 Tax=Mesorhabditis belari TaxID=2138241 RepID=A0AAF3J4E0_9BILA
MDFERDFPPLGLGVSSPHSSPPSSLPLNSPSTIHSLDFTEDLDGEEEDLMGELNDGDSLMSPCSIPSPLLQYRSPSEYGGPDTAQLLEFVNSRLSSVEQNDFGSDITSMASSESREGSTSLFYDVIQAQVALWTCVVSLLYSYAWRQHRKKFIMSIFLIVPTVFTASCVISGLLTTIVVLGRLFSTPYTYTDFINLKDKILPADEELMGRKRTLSGASTISWHSEQDLLPRPLCRRHSASNGSVNNASRPPSRKLSYCYSHFSAENGIEEKTE